MDFVKLDMLAQRALADGFALLIDEGVFNDPDQLALAVGLVPDDVHDLWQATDEGIAYPVAKSAIYEFSQIAKNVNADVEHRTLEMLTAFNVGQRVARRTSLALQ